MEVATLEIVFAIALFTVVITALALAVQLARSRLAPGGPIWLEVNGLRRFETSGGRCLLEALAEEGILLPAACGGTGACGLCRVRVLSGTGTPTPVEGGQITVPDRKRGVRLACQVRLREDLEVEVPEEALGVLEWTGRLRRARELTPLIRELLIDLPVGTSLDFRAGAFVELTCPPYRLRLGDLAVARAHPRAWSRMQSAELEAGTDQPVTRAYSLANHPGESEIALLDVRLALPPPGTRGIPPGVVSSWLFSLKEGDELPMRGPHGHFFVRESDRELVFVGGGVGMAPMRAHLFDLLERRGSKRRMSFWYGARSRVDLFYVEDFDALEARHENFSWKVALSEPAAEDVWEGPTGFIHRVLHDEYLGAHPAPEDCEYYLCGPPMMIRAVLAMLDGLGVERESIFFDDFGATAPTS